MQTTIDIPLIGSGYLGQSVNNDCQRTLNFYTDFDPDGKKKAILLPTPGATLFCAFPYFPIRGMHVFGAFLYVVAAQYLYKVTGTGTYTVVGTLSSTLGKVSMADNGTSPTGGDQLVIFDSVGGYIYNQITGLLVPITSSGFDGNSHVIFIKGFFVCKSSRPMVFLWSKLYDGTSWNALDFATKETTPDNLVAIAESHGDLYLIGQYYTEVWFVSTSGNPVFQKYPGVLIEHGCASADTVTKGNSSLYWIARNKNGGFYIVHENGYQVKNISTPQIEYKICSLADTYLYNGMNLTTGNLTSNAYFFTRNGHSFYTVTIGNEITLQYDILTCQWNEWATYPIGESITATSRHYGDISAYFYGMNILSDYYGTGLYFLDDNSFLDSQGKPIQRARITKHNFSPDDNNVIIDKLKLIVETGESLPDGSSAKMMLKWSVDGGHTYSTESWSPMGKIGEYLADVIWTGLGYGRDFVFWFECSDTIRPIIIKCIATIRKLIK